MFNIQIKNIIFLYMAPIYRKLLNFFSDYSKHAFFDVQRATH